MSRREVFAVVAGAVVGGTALGRPVPAAAQLDSFVDTSTDQTVDGVKTFVQQPIVPTGAFPEEAVANLVDDLAGKEPTIPLGTYLSSVGADSKTGVLTLIPTSAESTPLILRSLPDQAQALLAVRGSDDVDLFTVDKSGFPTIGRAGAAGMQGTPSAPRLRLAHGGQVDVESSFEVANWTTSFESGTYLCHSGGVGWNLTSNDLEEWAAGFIVEHKYRNISTDPFVIELHTVATGPLSQGSPMRRVVSHAIERSTPYKCTTYSLGEWAFCKADTAEVHLLVREPGFGLVHGGVGGDPRGDVSIYDGAKLQLTTMTGEGVLNGRGDILLTPSDAYPLIEFRLSGVTKGRIWCQLNNAYMVYDGGIGAVNHQFVDSVLVTTSAGIQRFAVGNTATTINGFLNHAGSRVGFYGTTPAPRVNGTPEAATDLHSVIALANALRTTILSVGLAV